MERSHSGGARQTDEYTLGCLLMSSDEAVGVKNTGAGSPTSCVGLREDGISTDSD